MIWFLSGGVCYLFFCEIEAEVRYFVLKDVESGWGEKETWIASWWEVYINISNFLRICHSSRSCRLGKNATGVSKRRNPSLGKRFNSKTKAVKLLDESNRIETRNSSFAVHSKYRVWHNFLSKSRASDNIVILRTLFLPDWSSVKKNWPLFASPTWNINVFMVPQAAHRRVWRRWRIHAANSFLLLVSPH